MLRVELRASPVLTLLTLAACASAAFALLAALPVVAGISCAALLGWIASRTVWERTLLRAPNAPLALEMGRDAGLTLRLRSGAELRGLASPRRYVSRWLVVVRLVRPGATQRTILVARDMLAAGEFRHMRLWALWGAVPDGGGAGP